MLGLKSKPPTPSTQQVLQQAEKVFARGVMTLRDIVAPAALEVNQNWIRVGERYARTLFVFTYPRYLSTNWFSPIVNLDQTFDISIFVHPVETAVVLRNLRKKIAEVESQVGLREQKGLVRDPMLETAYHDIEELRDRLQEASLRLFQFSLYITFWGKTPKELDDIETVVRSLLEGKMIYAKPAVFQQTEGLKSVLPFNEDALHITANLDSETISTTFPFVSFDLTSDRGVLYGINRHNNSLVLFDRFSLANANSVTFGVSGSGKSYATKLEIIRSLMFDTDIIVIDPENEYQRLAEQVGGAFLPISLTSKYHINPFDLPLPIEGESQSDLFRSHVLRVLGLLRIMLGGLSPEQDAMLDQAVLETYAARNITAESDFRAVTPPVLADLVTVLENLEGGGEIATRLRKYTEGTYVGFLNQPTNLDLENRLIIFNIRDLEDELRAVAMYLILHYIWNIVRSRLKKRLLIVDEAWWVMKYEEGAAFLFSIAKRARKYFLGLATITQDISDFMTSPYGPPIVTNAAMQLLFKQSPATMDAVQKAFALTDEEKYLLLESAVGTGLFFGETNHVAIQVVASYTEDQIVTSKPEDIIAMRET